MQSYSSESEDLVQTMVGTAEDLALAMQTGDYHVVGRIPKSGQEVMINGLVWIVERVNAQAGRMRLRLKKPID